MPTRLQAMGPLSLPWLWPFPPTGQRGGRFAPRVPHLSRSQNTSKGVPVRLNRPFIDTTDHNPGLSSQPPDCRDAGIMPLTVKNPAGTAKHSGQLSDLLSTKWLPQIPPRLMAFIEGWGYESLPDLSDKVFLITGGTSGIGKEASVHLAKAGARVIVASPDEERSQEAIRVMTHDHDPAAMQGSVEFMVLDLGSISSIRSFVDKFKSKHLPLHGLVCNAGLMLRAEQKTSDGMEQRWGVNYVGHFYLCHLLLDVLAKSNPSRIVWLSSIEEQWGKIRWDDPLGLEAPASADWYSTSKLANYMIAMEMARRLNGTGIDVFATHPGASQTDLFRKYTRITLGGVYRQMLQGVMGQSAYRGGLPIAYAVAEPSLKGKGGCFIGPYYWGQIIVHAYSLGRVSPKNPEAKDPHARYRLYEQTADALEEFLDGERFPHRLRGIPPLCRHWAGSKSPSRREE